MSADELSLKSHKKFFITFTICIRIQIKLILLIILFTFFYMYTHEYVECIYRDILHCAWIMNIRQTGIYLIVKILAL